MNDTDLERRLHHLAAAVPAPDTSPDDDLRRGRSRLRRTRLLVSGGSAAGVAAVVLGVAVLGNLGDEGRTPSPTAPATQVASEEPQPKPRPKVKRVTGGELIQTYRDVLAEHLDPEGTHLQRKPDNLQSGGGLGTKLGWSVPGQDGLGMVAVFVGGGWRSSVGAFCSDPAATCRELTVDGVDATVVDAGGATTVVVKRRDTTVAITVDALFGNNSLVPVEGMDLAVEDLVRAAADERLVLATPEQVRNAGASMGFPDVGAPGEPLEEGVSSAPVP